MTVLVQLVLVVCFIYCCHLHDAALTSGVTVRSGHVTVVSVTAGESELVLPQNPQRQGPESETQALLGSPYTVRLFGMTCADCTMTVYSIVGYDGRQYATSSAYVLFAIVI